jgi:hypothetical protein
MLGNCVFFESSMKPHCVVLLAFFFSTISLFQFATYIVPCSSLTPSEISMKEIRYECTLPVWINRNPAYMAVLMMNASMGLTDKVDTIHHEYQFLYFPYISSMIRDRYCDARNDGNSDTVNSSSRRPKIRMLEIGLGCAPTGGMIRGQPGGSALAWRHIFGNKIDDFELHVMEFDSSCAEKWAALNEGIAIVHYGDASSEVDLKRVVAASSRDGDPTPFDIIIDDASHINWHQIKTIETLIPSLRPGGFYVIEDIHSACLDWPANVGKSTSSESPHVGGTRNCMKTISGEPTIFARVIEWQKDLLIKKEHFPGVNHIDLHKEAVLFEKRV